ncbi:hypothetical protein C9I92_15240 [Photobacterium ganghwense]|uniref:Uncharacterized protein n=2 Tax=Photobacterium ganghwense TaxID=320778 RepID=A0A0J1H8G6_9GAMM|nr:hypothetical protein ABT57_14225 [Photobacterium ganghwense]PSU07107.1 hypothetical protein C9I92_15240 [Photobacterium ganghwense]
MVDTFDLPGFACAVEVRCLNMRTKNHRYIVVLDDFHNKKAWEEIPVLTEISFKHKKSRYLTSPASQYPELADYERYIIEHIDSIVAGDTEHAHALAV